jgi:transcriptional regulator with XRE-family HTH domain
LFYLCKLKEKGVKYPQNTYDKKMKDRIRQIMESQHMTQQVFAEFIGVGAATLSSIFNDRTRPTLNIVEAIKKKIPNISTDWLMFGSGDMYLSENPTPNAGSESGFQSADNRQMGYSPMLDFNEISSPTPQNSFLQPQNVNSVKSTRSENDRLEVKLIDKPQRKIVEIRVFYDDQTFDTFEPKKK